MGKRRGFFAEMQHQVRVKEQRQRQQQRATAQAHARAVRTVERTRRELQTARAADARMAAAESAYAEKERTRLHQESQLAEVDLLNAALAEQHEAIDGILGATLDVDDYVDLSMLRQSIDHPPFHRPDLVNPSPRPAALPFPAEPVYVEPRPPEGLGSMLGGRKRHATAVADAQVVYWQQRQGWEHAVAQRTRAEHDNERAYQQAEAVRRDNLKATQSQYDTECAQRRKEILTANVQLERLMTGLQDGDKKALEEYVSIVLGNSVYPECFEVEYDFVFHSQEHELELTVLVPHPSELATEKAFKYTKSTDAISSLPLPVKARKDRYTKAVAEVAIRTAHEIFEADRNAIVRTLSMTVAANTVDHATGHDAQVPLVQLATDRESFNALDLSRVDARATLEHLRAGVSKNPHDLVPIGNPRGVRG